MNRSYGWVVVGAGMLMTCIGIGAMFSLAVFLPSIAEATGWSRTGISSAVTLNFLFMAGAALAWGALSDRFGTRIVVLMGGVILGTGLAAASRATTIIEFQLLFGVLVGVAAGSFYAPMVSVATAWLPHRASIAAALVSAGLGAVSLTVVPFAGWLLTITDWRTAMLIIGGLSWLLVIPAALLVRQAPQTAAAGQAPAPGAVDDFPLTAAQALRTPQFIAIALTHFACCAAHSGPLFHMVSYAAFCGIPAMYAVSVYSLAGLSGLGGRIGLGLLADRLGAKPVLVAGLTMQALSIGTYLLVSRLGEFYALSIVFGIAYGGVMPLYAVLVRDYFGPRVMGTLFGGVTMGASLGMAFGPAAGGLVFDTYGNYAWLYIGSLTAGLGAAAVALTFRPIRLPPSEGRLDLKPA
jgi:MFS family permease